MANIGDLVATASLDIAPFEGNLKQLKMATRGLDNMLKTVENSVKGQGDKLNGLMGYVLTFWDCHVLL